MRILWRIDLPYSKRLSKESVRTTVNASAAGDRPPHESVGLSMRARRTFLVVGLISVVTLALLLPSVQVCRDWAFIDRNTGFNSDQFRPHLRNNDPLRRIGYPLDFA